MSDSIPPNTTAFEIPLTDRQLMHLGRITATWAQIEFFVDRLLMLALNLDPPAFNKQFSAMMVGGRLDRLYLESRQLSAPALKEPTIRFVEAALDVKAPRNHAAHGVWGLRVDGDKTFVAARHRKTPGVPMRAERLKALEKKVAYASILGANALGLWTGNTLIVPGRFHFGNSDTPPAHLGRSFPLVGARHPTRDHS